MASQREDGNPKGATEWRGTGRRGLQTSEVERAQSKKQGGGRLVVLLDPQEAEARLARESTPEVSPERLFDCYWAHAVLDAALVRLEAEFRRSGRLALFEQLQPFLEGDASGPTYTEVAQRLGTTEGTIKVTVHRLRNNYRQLLRVVVSQTVDSPLEIDSELAHLRAALRGLPGLQTQSLAD